MEFDQFLNVIYNSMCQRLKLDDDGSPVAARRELDNELSTVRWRVPGIKNKYEDAVIEEGAPAWWAGDEEASDATLASMRAMGAKV